MNAKRLLKLAAKLRTVNPKHFDMELWGMRGFDKSHCGTSACAGGWACTIPSFKRAGLAMEYYDEDSLGGTPVYTGGARYADGLQALEDFFEVEEKEASYLFGSYVQRSPKQEARVILNFVKTSKIPVKATVVL